MLLRRGRLNLTHRHHRQQVSSFAMSRPGPLTTRAKYNIECANYGNYIHRLNDSSLQKIRAMPPRILSQYASSGARFLSSSSSSSKAMSITDYEFSTLNEMYTKVIALFKDNLSFGTRQVDNKFSWISYGDFDKQVQLLRKVLIDHNIGKNDKVALICNNRVEWAISMYATLGVGAQLVPMYENQLERDWRFIVNDSAAKLVLVANEKIYNQIKDYPGNVGIVKTILCFDCDSSYIYSYQRWMKSAEKREKLSVPVAEVFPDHLACIVYTSGTTGTPKGVMLSHGNICSNLHGLKKIWKNNFDNQTSLAFLPWSHLYGQVAELHALVSTGSQLAIVSRDEILECLPIVKPTVILSVPMLFNKVYTGVHKRIANAPPLVGSLFRSAMAVARKVNYSKEMGEQPGFFNEMMYKFNDRLVFSRIRNALGGKVRFMGSGGAAVSLPVLQFFEDIGIPICEGYGLTETSPVITNGANNWETRRLGCSGVALHNVTVRIINPATLEEVLAGEEGEVCCTGPNVMVGYHNNPAANAEVFFNCKTSGHRYFRSGDIGKMVDNKFLQITGRIKEQFKLENAKYVVPAPLEDMVTRSHYINQCFLYGDNKPFTVLLVVPELNELKSWCKSKNIPVDDKNLSLLYKHPDVIAHLSREIKHVCLLMKSFEKPSRFLILDEPFSQDNQMMTPKMSLRRKNIVAKYGNLINDMYANDPAIAIGHATN